MGEKKTESVVLTVYILYAVYEERNIEMSFGVCCFINK